MSQLSTQVAAIDPITPGDAFTAYRDGDGAGPQLETIEAPGRDRLFELVATRWPADDGAAAVTSLRYRAGIAVLVLYQRGAECDSTRLERMVAEDTASIISRLGNPSNWDAAVTLIDAVIPRGPATTRKTGKDSALLLMVPFDLIYYET